MGVTTEQWRATIGRWSGGRPGKCVIIENSVTGKPDNDSYRWFRFFVLVLLLVIGCVELNPGPKNAKETSAPSIPDGALPKFSRRPGSVGLHGELYGIRMASFLFARGLNSTEEFQLASNVNGAASAFDDVVFKYKLKEQNVCKTCFIQLKHKKNKYTIQRSSLKQLSGDFSLFKYFESYCQIKKENSEDRNLKLCGLFDDYEFIIYTNARLKSKCVVEGVDINPVSILSSGPNHGEYITFDEKCDTDIFDFFKELSQYYNFLLELVNPVKVGACVDKEIEQKIDDIISSFSSVDIKKRLGDLKSEPSNDTVRKLIKELEKCDFSLYTEFLRKVKIFQCQSNESFLENLIKEELQVACHTSDSGTDSIYRKLEVGFTEWWKKSGSVEWLSESSRVWQSLKQRLIEKINEVSIIDIQESLAYGICFSQQHMQPLSDALQRSSLLNVITNTNCGTLSKLKIYQALNSLGYGNSLFISLKSLMNRREEIENLWPCKWSSVLVVHCEKGSDSVDNNLADILTDMLRDYKKKIILISQREHQQLASHLQQKPGNIYTEYKDKCNLLDLDDKSQKRVLKSTVDFQGTEVHLEELVGKDPPEIIKKHIDSDVLSLLLDRKQKLCIGRKLGDPSSYCVSRILVHRVYLNDDILRTTDNNITFAITGLRPNQLKQYLPVGEKIHKFKFDEIKKNCRFKIVDSFTKPGLVVGLECKRNQHNVLQSSKPEEVRYVIIGNKHPESDFNKLKKVCKNVHWVHMKDGSFIWRDSNCEIELIRGNIDNTKYKSYDVKSIMEHNDTTMLLAAEPGMGKSTFLSSMEHEIKNCKPYMWVLRINLHEHTSTLENIEFESDCIEKCKEFLWNAVHSPKQKALALVEKIFRQALEQTGNVVVILDGFDEISPDYSLKVEMLIREIRNKMASKIWVSSRSSYRIKLENIMMKFAFTLRPFTTQNQITCLEQNWNETIKNPKQESLRNFAKELLRLSSKNFNDKDGQFTGIPLQTMMLGEAFVNEAESYCLSGEVNLPENVNLLALFKKFTEKKCDIYFKEKNGMDCSKLQVKRDKNMYLEKHIIPALMSLFSPDELNRLLEVENTSYWQQTMEFLQGGEADQFGMITEFTDSKPRFIHRCFAEYFTAKWFTKNFNKCGSFISDSLFNSTYEVIRNIFDRMLAEEFKLHDAVLNNDLEAVCKLLKETTDVNSVDNGGRTALHLAASYNSIITKTLLSVPGVDTNITDRVLKWTPLRYADTTRSWMAMDSLLQSGGNGDDIVLTRCKIEQPEWGQLALWESAQKGHKKLLEFMLNSGFDVNALVRVRASHLVKCTLLHIASLHSQEEVVKFIIERGADINIRSFNDNTALHFAAQKDNVGIITLLLDKGVSVNVTSTHGETPLHHAAYCGNLRGTNVLVKRGAALEKTNKIGHTPLMVAALAGKLEVVRYLVNNGADINVCNDTESALHLATDGARLDVMCFLLEQGADINGSKVERGFSPLQLAILRQNLQIVKYLIERGADVNLCTRKGWNMTAVHLAVLSGNLESLDCLTEAGANLNALDRSGCTPLHWAVANNNTALALHLVEKGADVNIVGFERQTPLHLSVLHNNVNCAKHFVKFNANINYQGPNKTTALSIAIEQRRIHMVNILVENGATINLRDDFGNTALHVAVAKCDPGLVHYLIDRGADINIPNNRRNTPLHWIISRQWKILVDHLEPNKLRSKIDKIPLEVEVIEIGKAIAIGALRSNTELVMLPPLLENHKRLNFLAVDLGTHIPL